MDQRERSGDLFEALRMAMDGREAHTWQGGPGVIQSFDPAAMTCVVQPSIQGRVTSTAGAASYVNLPLLLDVPVVFQSGGGATMTFPIKSGDECFFSIADRCIDGWWQQGGIQPPMEARMHDLSDAFAFVGPRSQPRVLGAISTTTVQLRSDDGAAFVELDPTGHLVKIKATTITLDGNVVVTGTSHLEGAVTLDSTATTHEIDATVVKIGGVAVVAP